jgi:hypothetical protein
MVRAVKAQTAQTGFPMSEDEVSAQVSAMKGTWHRSTVPIPHAR